MVVVKDLTDKSKPTKIPLKEDKEYPNFLAKIPSFSQHSSSFRAIFSVLDVQGWTNMKPEVSESWGE